MKNLHAIRILGILAALLFSVAFSASAKPSSTELTIAPRYSLAGNIATSYSPGNEIQFGQLVGAVIYDYDQVWPHRTPEPLRFKVETAVGLAAVPHTRATVSINMLALYFLEPLTTATLHPYFEAGIGLIYTDFQIDGQGLRYNFNPQIGIGSEIVSTAGTTYFCATRLHHISNCGLDDDNHGINSILFQFGRFF
jgi:hypothetical protein